MRVTGPQPLLPAALFLHELGISVIPAKYGQKKAAVRWKSFQSQGADEATLRRWFGDLDNCNLGIAIVLGNVSGGVLVRDFDRRDGYLAWKRTHPELARSLPTVKTHRGHHIYFRAERYKPPGDKTFCARCGDGELRGDGHIVLAPPTIHGKSGLPYRWLAQPTDSIPLICLEGSGLLPPAANVTQEMSCVTSALLPAVLSEALPEIIQRTLPRGPGERHRQVFEFARHLRRYDELAGQAPVEFKAYVHQWHAAALPFIRTKDFQETFADFENGWERVRYAAGAGTLTAAMQRAMIVPPPPAANEYRLPSMRLLVGLCRELQRQAGGQPFFLSCRDAARLLGLTGEQPHVRAHRWLGRLCHDRILERVSSGTFKNRKANEYRYLAAVE